MTLMFSYANSFNGDISKWHVSRVGDMSSMFYFAKSFNGDLSKWDVSSVIQMDYMFANAMSFRRNLCGIAWVYSKASQIHMFTDSPGSISWTVCTRTWAFCSIRNCFAC